MHLATLETEEVADSLHYVYQLIKAKELNDASMVLNDTVKMMQMASHSNIEPCIQFKVQNNIYKAINELSCKRLTQAHNIIRDTYYSLVYT